MLKEDFFLFCEPPTFSEDEQKRRRAVDRMVHDLSLQLILSQDEIDSKLMRIAARCINQNHYDGVVEERDINGHCGYPLCHKLLPELSLLEKRQEYTICSKQNALFRIGRRKHFCCGICFASSEHFRKQLSTDSVYLIASCSDQHNSRDITLSDQVNPQVPRRLTLGHEVISKRVLFEQCINRPGEYPSDETFESYLHSKLHTKLNSDAEENSDCRWVLDDLIKGLGTLDVGNQRTATTQREIDTTNEQIDQLANNPRELCLPVMPTIQSILEDIISQVETLANDGLQVCEGRSSQAIGPSPAAQRLCEWITGDTRHFLGLIRMTPYERRVRQFLSAEQDKGSQKTPDSSKIDYVVSNFQRSLPLLDIDSNDRTLWEIQQMNGKIGKLVRTFSLTNTNSLLDTGDDWNRMAMLLLKLLEHFKFITKNRGRPHQCATDKTDMECILATLYKF